MAYDEQHKKKHGHKHDAPREVAVAVVFCPETHRVLMVTSRKHQGLWIFPKGGVEKKETSGQAAAREAHEEAGIPAPNKLPQTAISPQLLQLDIPTKPKHKDVAAIWHVHGVSLKSEDDLLSDWDEVDERKRAWHTVHEARSLLRQWGGHGSAEGLADDGEASFLRGGRGKKAIKGEAMELALNAFTEHYGWDKA